MRPDDAGRRTGRDGTALGAGRDECALDGRGPDDRALDGGALDDRAPEDRALDGGAAVVDFVLVSVLVLALFLLVLQVAVALHVRNVLVASAAEGARYAADADRTSEEGVARARQAVADALSPGLAARMTYVPTVVDVGGAPVVEVTVSGPLPVVFLPSGALSITVHGHALEESR